MTDDNKNKLSTSAKRRLRKKALDAKRQQRGGTRHGDTNWQDGAKVAVLTGENKSEHAAAVLNACLRLQADGKSTKPRKLISFKTDGGNVLTYVG